MTYVVYRPDCNDTIISRHRSQEAADEAIRKAVARLRKIPGYQNAGTFERVGKLVGKHVEPV